MEEPKVKYPPSIDMKPEPVEVAEGEPAKFMVKVSGYPRPRVTWWVNGTMIMTVSTLYNCQIHWGMSFLNRTDFNAVLLIELFLVFRVADSRSDMMA